PDACLIMPPEFGGRVKLDDAGYIVGGPEFVGEVSSTKVSYDSTCKIQAYERHGVQEYLVWRVFDNEMDWYRLRNGRFEPLLPGSDGILRSEIMPGLWLDPGALIADDFQTVLSVLHQGLASPEHAAFVEQLRQNAQAGAGG